MPFESVKEFYAVLKECDTASLYEAAKAFAKNHRSYSVDDNRLSIDKTSQTVMENMLAKTELTPENEAASMRAQRKTAIWEFCCIYGGYIAYKLQLDCQKKGYSDLAVKDEYIAIGVEQLLAGIIRTLEKNGYKQGTFSHLVNKAIKRKCSDISERYVNWKKKNYVSVISFENAEAILGGVIELADENGIEYFDDDEKSLEVAGVFQLLEKVKTENSADDRNMFILYRIQRHKLADIAAKFEISIATASRRINKFADAAIKLYRQSKKNIEHNDA